MADPRPWWRRAFAWEVPFLAALGAFMLWVRLLPFKPLLGSGRAYYIGTDPFYHYRETLGIVRAFPRVPRWDPWTFYPHGTGTGQFGSLFDWSAAAYVVLTQGRDASEAYVATVLGVFPAVLGALLLVPFYYVAKRLLGTAGAVVASLTLAVLPGEFLVRSLAGYADHHVAEALFALVSILGVYVAAVKGHDARAAVRAWREPRGYWKAAAFGVLGGVALAANVYAWPPALLFLGILTAWLTIVILLEDGRGGDGTGYAFGGSVAFVVSALLLAPAVETTFLGEFNTYGLLHVVAGLGAAGWLWVVHLTSRATRARGWSPWVVPAIIVGFGAVAFLVLATTLKTTYANVLWGLSWVTGIGVQRTTLTIAEARRAKFFCAEDTREFSCLATDFGLVAPVAVLLLFALLVWVLVKRRREDILLLLWSLVMVRATQTQIRFSYYLALNLALLVGWLAARLAEWTGLHAVERAPVAAPAPRGRKTRKAAVTDRRSLPWRVAVVGAVLLLVLPTNVFATDRGYPGWRIARSVGADGDLVLWMEGLDWMRQHTPDAGVDLSLVVDRPPPGQLYDYPPQSYGVLSWWDYGHWIQTVAQRPPVANPFQQAAPFASLWFTERDPAQAERMLDEWVQDKGPVRYVWIDDAMATGKFSAITVWAHSLNASRPALVDPATGYLHEAWLARQTFSAPDGPVEGTTIGAAYKESMMGRLYDGDGNGLQNYRLVWEAPAYDLIVSASGRDGSLRCFHDVVPSGSCNLPVDYNALARLRPGEAMRLGDGTVVYDVLVASRLKLFERVEGARIVGTAPPGSQVRVGAVVAAQPEDAFQTRGAFQFEVVGTAGPDGRYSVTFPYSNVEPLGPANGGTDLHAHVLGRIVVSTQGGTVEVDVPERAVLEGLEVNAD
ncbi:MAG TPA: oligosaccharyl transferase, archaeosortase A system-associated [Candidatus Thermoplasmatota archaeon]|nr:oligosaccharyl transferase, archaeosortase A system-associated [Candidatus Thermoplasmatota archaeon]